MSNNKLAQVFHFDLQGKRDAKYDFLNNKTLASIDWNNLQPDAPNFFFVKKNFDEAETYEKGFKVDEFFVNYARGLTTERDTIIIQFEASDVNSIISDFKKLEVENIRNKYDKKPDGRDWKYIYAKNDLITNTGKLTDIAYRPFDIRKTFYTGKSKGFMAYPRNGIMRHFLTGENVGLVSRPSKSLI
jgi:hypothetical protein